jgi:hypothetical protein
MVNIGLWTHALVGLSGDKKITFEILFPIVAGLAVTIGILCVQLLVKVMKWIVLKLGIPSEGYTEVNNGFSYFLDPLYSAELRSEFGKLVKELNETADLQQIIVVSEGIGGLLAYEVLSRSCRAEINKPVYLITRNLFFAGFPISPTGSLWLWVDISEWSRFSLSTPINLSWHHFTPWPTGEKIIELISLRGIKLPKVEVHTEIKRNAHRRSDTLLSERLIAMLE